MDNHYYFKLGVGNNLFKPTDEGELLTLSIYFNDEKPGWKISPYLTSGIFNETQFLQDAKSLKVSGNSSSLSQVKSFVQASLPENWERSFLWIFYHPKLYVFQPTSLIYDGEVNESKFYGHQPKDMKAVCKKVFSMEDVPEFFAALNANQGYNRLTIRKFENSVHKVAEHLLFPKEERLKIESSKKFDFLSPVQFETLVFLIFHHAGAFCSTFRGGTRPGIDLLAEFSETPKLPGFPTSGKYFLQVKMKNSDVPKPSSDHRNEFLIWLGDSDFEHRVLGQEWIESQIFNHVEVSRWLNRSLGFLQYQNEW